MAAIEKQLKRYYSICNSFINYKKLGSSLRTKGACIARLDKLKSTWDDFEKLHDVLIEDKNTDKRDSYFTEDIYSKASEAYLVAAGQFQDCLLEETDASSSQHNQQPQDGTHIDYERTKLPQIELETFSGDIEDWVRFRDTFTEMIINRPALPNIYKMNYLRRSVKGEAADIIAEVPASGDNFTNAWKTLLAHYDNKRILIRKLVMKIHNMEEMANNTSAELMRVHNTMRNMLQALRALGSPVDSWDHLTVNILYSKLTLKLQTKWEDMHAQAADPTIHPTFADLSKYLDAEKNTLYLIESQHEKKTKNPTSSNSKFSSAKKRSTNLIQNKEKKNDCPICNNDHFITRCDTFLSIKPTERKQLAVEKHLCYNCLGNHHIKECKSTRTCMKCSKKHHTLLHFETEHKSASTDTSNGPKVSNAFISCSDNKQIRVESLLATARVKVLSNSFQFIVRALIDQCAQSSFVTEELCQRLQLKKRRTHLPISGIGQSKLNCENEVMISIKPHFESDFICKFSAYVLPKITSYTPTYADLKKCKHLKDIMLADPDFYKPGVIDLLLGTQIHAQIIQEGLRKGMSTMPIAMNSSLGWILSGAVSNVEGTKHLRSIHLQSNDSLEKQLKMFWEIEEIPKASILTEEEQLCEDHYVHNTSRLPNGAYQVRLPRRATMPDQWANSHQIAKSCLFSLERKLNKKTEFRTEYNDALSKMIEANYMSKITIPNEKITDHYFLPHHAVIKESSNTTRLRPVFNASARNSEGNSLNDHLMIGANLLPDIVLTVNRWRCYKFAFVADVSKMYLRIALHPDDWKLQTILWRSDPHDEISTYVLPTVTFGCSSSSFLASRTLRQLANDEGINYSQAVNVLREEMYMDDVLSGDHDMTSALIKQEQLNTMMSKGNFQLAKWMSNDERLLEKIDTELIATEATLKVGMGFSVLGLVWNPILDVFQFNAVLPTLEAPLTRRKVLSSVAGMFDPCGWISPIIVQLKIFLQSLWIVTSDWDTPLPSTEENKWLNFREDLQNIKTIEIPRFIGYSLYAKVELHGFSDASRLAYAAALYIRIIQGENVIIQLLSSKTKVAPIKTQSIPRLELCAAHLLVKLVSSFVQHSPFNQADIHLWTDSRNVLHWLHGIPAKWPTFVANRCGEIATLLPHANWHHVRTHENPADISSRGCNATELKDSILWWQGPSFLKNIEINWTAYNLNKTFVDEDDAAVIIQSEETIEEEFIIRKYSSLNRLLRITVLILRFLQKLSVKHKHKMSELFNRFEHNNDFISSLECDIALQMLCRMEQQRFYPVELKKLANGEEIPKKSKILNLCPIIDHGLIRVGGRLRHSLLDYNEKHPIILHCDSNLTKLLIAHYHFFTLHGGKQLVIFHLRQKFWIPRVKLAVKTFISHCVKCIRYKAEILKQKMADLPTSRLQISRPFSKSGIDYAGPFLTRVAKHRGSKTIKSYVAVFICMVTKATHLELVSSYDTASFLAAFKRFTARRGYCQELYSDQGTTFIGADAELRRMFKSGSKFLNDINQSLSIHTGTTWKFNPPGAPHFGGLWEACVKSVKFHLKRVVGDALLTYEEFSTLLTQIEAILNSRPLLPLTDDPNDVSVLTPAHFLIGEPTLLLTEPVLLDEKISLLDRWKSISHMTQSFWKVWSREYLQNLQKRGKWQRAQTNVKPGDIVLLKNENMAPTNWPLARVIKTHPGSDGLIRVVTLCTGKSTYQRPIHKLVKLFES